MKKNLSSVFLLAFIISISALISYSSHGTSFDSPFILGVAEEPVEEPVDELMEESGGVSDELAYRAYDAIFSLSFATLEAGLGDNGITAERVGDTSTFSFENTGYLLDEPNATVSGYMKATDGGTTDQSDVNFTFTNDPFGLKTITIKSSGDKGVAHANGTITINGIERPFEEFVGYFGSKLNQQMNIEANATPQP